MAQLPTNPRKALLAASSTAVLAGGLLIFTEMQGGGGPQSWGQFVLGAIVGVAVAAAIVFAVKRGRGGQP